MFPTPTLNHSLALQEWAAVSHWLGRFSGVAVEKGLRSIYFFFGLCHLAAYCVIQSQTIVVDLNYPHKVFQSFAHRVKLFAEWAGCCAEKTRKVLGYLPLQASYKCTCPAEKCVRGLGKVPVLLCFGKGGDACHNCGWAKGVQAGDVALVWFVFIAKAYLCARVQTHECSGV